MDDSWEPLHKLKAVLRVEIDGDAPLAVARATRHREATLQRWLTVYRADGRDAFFPLRPAGDAARGATLEGMLGGRLVEGVWHGRTASALSSNLALRDAREQDPDPGWDFEIRAASGAAGGFTIDVKLHSEQFRDALKYTDLAPDDCIPLGLYKLLVARERQRRGGSHHIYCFVFRPALSSGVSTALHGVLPRSELDALALLFRTTAAGRARPQRRAVGTVIDRHLALLAPLLDGYEFRVISTWRAVNLFLEKVANRCPHIAGKIRGGTINMHYSWGSEMSPWDQVLHRAGQDLSQLLDDFAQGRV